MNSLIGSAAGACIEHVFVNVPRPTDGHKLESIKSHKLDRSRTSRGEPIPDLGRSLAGDILAAHAPVAELVDAKG